MEITTAAFAALPTPWVPCDAWYPWYEPTTPIVNPNIKDFMIEDQISINLILSKAF